MDEELRAELRRIDARLLVMERVVTDILQRWSDGDDPAKVLRMLDGTVKALQTTGKSQDLWLAADVRDVVDRLRREINFRPLE